MRGKLDPKCGKYIMILYANNRYKLWNPECRKLNECIEM